MAWSAGCLLLKPSIESQQKAVLCRAQYGVVFRTERPLRASVQEGIDNIRVQNAHLQRQLCADGLVFPDRAD